MPWTTNQRTIGKGLILTPVANTHLVHMAENIGVISHTYERRCKPLGDDGDNSVFPNLTQAEQCIRPFGDAYLSCGKAKTGGHSQFVSRASTESHCKLCVDRVGYTTESTNFVALHSAKPKLRERPMAKGWVLLDYSVQQPIQMATAVIGGGLYIEMVPGCATMLVECLQPRSRTLSPRIQILKSWWNPKLSR